MSQRTISEIWRLEAVRRIKNELLRLPQSFTISQLGQQSASPYRQYPALSLRSANPD